MADTKISALTEETAPAYNDSIAVYDASAGTTDQVLLSKLFGVFMQGHVARSLFTWGSATTIKIGPGVYHLSGTTNALVWINTEMTFTVGSGGSNASSSNASASAFHYIYIDDSAVETLIAGAAPALTNSESLNSTTAPTWSASKHGLYNSSDRCIGAIYFNSSSQVDEFFHSGDYFSYNTRFPDLPATDIDTTWTDVTLSLPAFVRRAEFTFQNDDGGAEGWSKWRTNGAAATVDGKYISRSSAAETPEVWTVHTVIVDSNLKIEIKNDASNAAELAGYTNGWYFPEGM